MYNNYNCEIQSKITSTEELQKNSMESDDASRFRNEDIVSITKLIQVAKFNGKSKDYIAHRIMQRGCPIGRKNCCVCSRGDRGKSLNKSKGRNKRSKDSNYEINIKHSFTVQSWEELND